MSPGTTKLPGVLTVRDFSPFGVFGARDRLPTHAISPSLTTIVASDIELVPSKRPSISMTVRIARQYRPVTVMVWSPGGLTHIVPGAQSNCLAWEKSSVRQTRRRRSDLIGAGLLTQASSVVRRRRSRAALPEG